MNRRRRAPTHVKADPLDSTSPLPAGGGRSAAVHAGRNTSTAQAHRVRLYGALDEVCVPLGAADVRAVFELAELDGVTVQAVIDWINTARTLGHLT